jgi:hypothetical protein
MLSDMEEEGKGEYRRNIGVAFIALGGLRLVKYLV